MNPSRCLLLLRLVSLDDDHVDLVAPALNRKNNTFNLLTTLLAAAQVALGFFFFYKGMLVAHGQLDDYLDL